MDSAAQPSMTDALDLLWARFLPRLNERVAVLEDAAQALTARSLSLDRQTAAAAAHKLAGVLGTFGLTEGTDVARELESLYSCQNGPDPSQGAQLTALAARLRTIVESRPRPSPPPEQLHFG